MFNLVLFIMATLTKTTLQISSPDFKHNDYIPSRFTCDGEEINPTLSIAGVPEGTKSLVLIVDDPDAPNKTFDHWIVWNISPRETIQENSVPGIMGKNGKGESKYTGPCPPPPTGTHRYFFKLYALDTMLDNEEGDDKATIEAAMKGHILVTAELIGLYARNE